MEQVEGLAWITAQVKPETKRQIRIKAAKKSISVSKFVGLLLERLVEAEPEEIERGK